MGGHPRGPTSPCSSGLAQGCRQAGPPGRCPSLRVDASHNTRAGHYLRPYLRFDPCRTHRIGGGAPHVNSAHRHAAFAIECGEKLMGCDKPFSLDDQITHLSVHAEEKLNKLGLTLDVVQQCLRSGETLWDSKHDTISFVLQDRDTNKTTVVALNPHTGRVTTVMHGSRVVSSRLSPMSIA